MSNLICSVALAPPMANRTVETRQRLRLLGMFIFILFPAVASGLLIILKGKVMDPLKTMPGLSQGEWAELLNSASGAYLAVQGIVYGLRVQQTVSLCEKRVEMIRAALANEVATLSRLAATLLALQGISVASEDVANIVRTYAHSLLAEMRQGQHIVSKADARAARFASTDELQAAIPVLLRAVCAPADGLEWQVSLLTQQTVTHIDQLVTLRFERSAEQFRRVLTGRVRIELCTIALPMFIGFCFWTVARWPSTWRSAF